MYTCINEMDKLDILAGVRALGDEAFIFPMEPSNVKEDT